jgi:TetR/AcrR family transcriptional repressor of nem operon
MPWQKQFDVDLARDRAKALFWKQGYEATSMEDLLRVMGISRASFYDTFGSKQAVYVDVLRRYDQQHRRDVFERLASDLTPRQAILALFDAVRAEACAKEGTRGCFLANAALELAGSDKSVAQIVRAAFSETEEFFCQAILKGQRSGEIRREVDPDATARSLLGLMLGMRVLARSGARPQVLDSITSQVPAML